MGDKNNTHHQNFPKVTVVQASAGSGKTYQLAKQYLRLLINPYLPSENIPLRSILAITFTNKATVEMKERILDILKRISLDAFSDKQEEKDILEFLGVEKCEARKKASLIIDKLIKHYNFFQVQTIDSFINALLLGCALNIDRSANFKIKRDYEQHISYCLDLVIEQTAYDKEVFDFLEEFLEHYLFVENRSGWFPKDDIRQLLRSLFRIGNKYGKAFYPFKGESKEIIKKKKHIHKSIFEFSNDFPDGMNKSAQNAIVSFLEKNSPIFEINALPKKLEEPFIPMNKASVCASACQKKWERLHKQLHELIELDAKVAYNPYVKLFDKFTDFFQGVCRKEDILFLEELNRKARSIFDEENLTVAELYYRLATRFRHYLIDEFQDTSFLQWNNLEVMIQEALASGGTLFYVGDKKQAIYRFRGGEAKLFDSVKDKLSIFNVEESALLKNWRSQKAIVEFNNKVFSKENLKRAIDLSGIAEELGRDNQDVSEILKVFKDVIQECRKENEAGYVYVERISHKSQPERDEIIQPKLLKLVEDLKNRFSYEDIAILTRDNNEVELVTSWLLEAGFPVESEKTLNLTEHPLIKEVISFLKFLYSPVDDLPFASFILGEIFSSATNIADDEIKRFIFNLNNKGKLNKTISLYHLFREKYPQLWQGYIETFFKNVGFISPYELLSAFYQRFQVMANFKESQGFFMKLLELVKSKEEDYIGLEEFLLYLSEASPEDLYVNVTECDSIKVLTIHKSKGLEFPVVILPFLRMDISPETGGKQTSSYVVPIDTAGLGLLRITKKHIAYSSALKKIYTHSYKNACIDELNNIYVALTRPQFELYIFIPKKSSSGNNKVWQLIPEDLGETGSKIKYGRLKKRSQKVIKFSPSVYKNWLESLRDEFGRLDEFRNRQQIQAGNILHVILSKVGNCFGRDPRKVSEDALNFARLKFPFVRDFSEYEKKTDEILKDIRLKGFFYVPEGKVYCEKEITNRAGDLKRIDRLIIDKNSIFVIDYKSSEQDEDKHRTQLSEYVDIVKDIYPKQKVKGYIIYLDELRLKEL